MYTDGVIEGRDAGRAPFGLKRPISSVTRQIGACTPAPEIVRQLALEIGDHQQHRLSDDATIVLPQWKPTDQT